MELGGKFRKRRIDWLEIKRPAYLRHNGLSQESLLCQHYLAEHCSAVGCLTSSNSPFCWSLFVSWHCSKFCLFTHDFFPHYRTRISTRLGLAETTLTNYPEWLTSMNSAHSTSGVPFSGTRVYVHTSVYSLTNGVVFTGYGIYDSNALTKAGFSITTTLSTITACPTTASSTPALPPSPTGSDCTPHGDHCQFCTSCYL